MESKTRIWSVAASVVAVTLFFICSAVYLFWKGLPPEIQVFLLLFLKKHFLYFFSFACLLLIGLGLLLDGIIHIYVLPINRLIEETSLIGTVNPSHRIAPDGSPDVQILAKVINKLAERYQKLQTRIRGEIEKSKADVERERNILATLIKDFPEGVLVCNLEGQILLYNRRATYFFSRHSGERPPPEDFNAGQDSAARNHCLP
jgi:DNA polymerase III subunit epsilon